MIKNGKNLSGPFSPPPHLKPQGLRCSFLLHNKTLSSLGTSGFARSRLDSFNPRKMLYYLQNAVNGQVSNVHRLFSPSKTYFNSLVIVSVMPAIFDIEFNHFASSGISLSKVNSKTTREISAHWWRIQVKRLTCSSQTPPTVSTWVFGMFHGRLNSLKLSISWRLATVVPLATASSSGSSMISIFLKRARQSPSEICNSSFFTGANQGAIPLVIASPPTVKWCFLFGLKGCPCNSSKTLWISRDTPQILTANELFFTLVVGTLLSTKPRSLLVL